MFILALTLNETTVGTPALRYLTLFYLAVLLVTLLTVIIHFIILIKELIKVIKVKSVLKRACIGFAIGVVIVVLLSLVKNHQLFSLDFIYILIASPILSLLSLFLQIEKK